MLVVDTGWSTAQKIKFSIKDFFSKCAGNPQETEGILNGEVHFFCSDLYQFQTAVAVINNHNAITVMVSTIGPKPKLNFKTKF